MNDNFKKQISDIEDLNEIAQIIAESTELRERISGFEKEPFSKCFSAAKKPVSMSFKKKGDTIYIVGDYTCSEDDNSSVLEIILEAMDQDLITTAHTLENGLFWGMIEACSVQRLGFDITSLSEIPEKDFLFKDNNPAILVGLSSDKEGRFVDFIYNNGIEITLLGHVTKGELRVDDTSFGFIGEYID